MCVVFTTSGTSPHAPMICCDAATCHLHGDKGTASYTSVVVPSHRPAPHSAFSRNLISSPHTQFLEEPAGGAGPAAGAAAGGVHRALEPARPQRRPRRGALRARAPVAHCRRCALRCTSQTSVDRLRDCCDQSWTAQLSSSEAVFAPRNGRQQAPADCCKDLVRRRGNRRPRWRGRQAPSTWRACRWWCTRTWRARSRYVCSCCWLCSTW